MRADRLISIALLLQQRKKISAENLAEELGVSIRTIYRDLVVLSANGFPIYAEHGPGGGVCIVEDYQGGVKTLTRDEVDALQMMRIPDPLTSLEAGKTMQRALLKLFASLPDQPESSPNLYIDWNGWRHTKNNNGGNLEQVYKAVCNRQTLQISFPLWNRMEFAQQVDPYGVVAKAGEWFLVYAHAGRIRMKRISSLLSIEFTQDTFDRPAGFDLESAWNKLCLEEEADSYSYKVIIRLSPEVLPLLKEPMWGIPYQICGIESEPDEAGWRKCTLEYENLLSARTHLLGLGGAVEVLAPEPLRISVLDFACQTQRIYQ